MLARCSASVSPWAFLPSFLYDFVLYLHTVSFMKETVKLPIFLFLKCYHVSQKLGIRQGTDVPHSLSLLKHTACIPQTTLTPRRTLVSCNYASRHVPAHLVGPIHPSPYKEAASLVLPISGSVCSGSHKKSIYPLTV